MLSDKEYSKTSLPKKEIVRLVKEINETLKTCKVELFINDVGDTWYYYALINESLIFNKKILVLLSEFYQKYNWYFVLFNTNHGLEFYP